MFEENNIVPAESTDKGFFDEFGVDVAEGHAESHAPKGTDWLKVGVIVSSICAVLSAAVLFIFSGDAFLKVSAKDSFIFTSGLVSKGDFLCSRVQGYLSDDFEGADGCLPLADFQQDVDDKTADLKAKVSEELRTFLVKKLNSDVLDSSLAHFILSKGEKARIPYVKLLSQINEKRLSTIRETGISGVAVPDGKEPIDCGSVSFVKTTISFSCQVTGNRILGQHGDSRATARIAALAFLKNLANIDRVKVKTLLKNMSSTEDENVSSTSVQVEMEYILDPNQLQYAQAK